MAPQLDILDSNCPNGCLSAGSNLRAVFVWIGYGNVQAEAAERGLAGGREGYMSGQTQARAWALREVWRDENGEKTYGMLTHIASKLYTITPPRKKKEHPSSQALGQLFDKMDNDQEWFPGQSDQGRHGPAPAINGTNQGIIARSAMTMKENGKEVTYPQLVAHNPKACVNPATNRPQKASLKSAEEALP